jgi:hypothetical protein
MSAVDFETWVTPDLEIRLPAADGTPGGRTYMVRPPSVQAAKQILAAAVRGEVRFGLVKGEIPEAVQAVLDTIGDTHPGLGAVYDQMVEDGVPAANIDRVSVYSVFFWARGKDYADSLAKILWTPQVSDEPEAGGAGPKGS